MSSTSNGGGHAEAATSHRGARAAAAAAAAAAATAAAAHADAEAARGKDKHTTGTEAHGKNGSVAAAVAPSPAPAPPVVGTKRRAAAIAAAAAADGSSPSSTTSATGAGGKAAAASSTPSATEASAATGPAPKRARSLPSDNVKTLRARLVSELKELLRDKPAEIGAAPKEDNFFVWSAHIEGPPDTPYEGGFFELEIVFPQEYPFVPPGVRFITKIYHPNINNSGGICLDILKDQWSPALTVTKVLLAISSLLAEPNPRDPLVPEVAALFDADRDAFNAKARASTLKNAISKKS